VLDVGGVGLCLGAIAGCGDDEAAGDAACRALEALHCASELGGSRATAGGGGGTAADAAAAENVEAMVEARLREEREVGLRFCEEQLIAHVAAAAGRHHHHKHGGGNDMGSPDRNCAACRPDRGGSSASGDRVMQQALLNAAAVLLDDDSVRHRALGLVEPVVTCMQTFSGQMKVQVAACNILAKLTSGHLAKDEAVARVAKCGALGALGQAMRDLPCNPELQLGAISVMMNATRNSNENKTLGVKGGGIPATIAAMRRFPKDGKLQEQAIGALTNLCDTVGRSQACARQGGLEAIVEAVKRHVSVGRIPELGFVILCMFCDDAQLRMHVSKSGIVPIAKTLSKSGSRDVQRWASELLKELITLE